MNKILTGLLIALSAAGASAAGLHIQDAWARATVEGMKMGGAFMTIHNDTDRQDALLGGSSPAAERVEVHTHINDNGVMRMRQAKDGAPLPAHAATELKPGSYHIMFMGLKQPLKEGQTVPVTLKFKNSQAQTLDIPVKTAPDEADRPHSHGGSAHQH